MCVPAHELELDKLALYWKKLVRVALERLNLEMIDSATFVPVTRAFQQVS